TLGQGTTFTVSIPTGKTHLPADKIVAPISTPATALGLHPFVAEAWHWLPEELKGPSAEEDSQDEVQAWIKPDGDKVRILLADDNADIRNYVGRILQPYCRLEMVSDGEAALAAARRNPPDLILSDVMMPKMDGLALLTALRNDPN